MTRFQIPNGRQQAVADSRHKVPAAHQDRTDLQHTICHFHQETCSEAQTVLLGHTCWLQISHCCHNGDYNVLVHTK